MRLINSSEFRQQTIPDDEPAQRRVFLEMIGTQLESYEQAYVSEDIQVLERSLSELIDACEDYLELIDMEDRAQPQVRAILGLQRKAVEDYYWVAEILGTRLSKRMISDQEGQKIDITRTQFSEARARWQLLINYYDLKRPRLVKLVGVYFQEFKFKGQNTLKQWLDNEDDLSTFHEIRAKGRENPTRDVFYCHPLGQFENKSNDFLVIIKNGLFYKAKQPDVLIDTSMSTSAETNVRGIIYVMDHQGKMYASPDNDRLAFKFHHSTFVNGVPVLCAGDMEIQDGRLTYISNLSGHYQPSNEHVLNLLVELDNQGVDLTHVKLKLARNDHIYNAADFLKNNGFTLANIYKAKVRSAELMHAMQIDLLESFQPITPTNKTTVENIEMQLAKLMQNNLLTIRQKLLILDGMMASLQTESTLTQNQKDDIKLLHEQLQSSRLDIDKYYDYDFAYEPEDSFESYQEFVANLSTQADMTGKDLLDAAKHHLQIGDVEKYHDLLFESAQMGNGEAQFKIQIYVMQKRYEFTKTDLVNLGLEPPSPSASASELTSLTSSSESSDDLADERESMTLEQRRLLFRQTRLPKPIATDLASAAVGSTTAKDSKPASKPSSGNDTSLKK